VYMTAPNVSGGAAAEHVAAELIIDPLDYAAAGLAYEAAGDPLGGTVYTANGCTIDTLVLDIPAQPADTFYNGLSGVPVNVRRVQIRCVPAAGDPAPTGRIIFIDEDNTASNYPAGYTLRLQNNGVDDANAILSHVEKDYIELQFDRNDGVHGGLWFQTGGMSF
jgi:hypothetical protein